jgi:hypothetical protein
MEIDVPDMSLTLTQLKEGMYHDVDLAIESCLCSSTVLSSMGVIAKQHVPCVVKDPVES